MTGRQIQTGLGVATGWQAKRREKTLAAVEMSPEKRAELDALTPEEKVRRQENSNINHMMRIHKRIDEIVEDKATADALKPWYMFMCKRPCFHNEYLPTFNLPNVTLVDTKGKGLLRSASAAQSSMGWSMSWICSCTRRL